MWAVCWRETGMHGSGGGRDHIQDGRINTEMKLIGQGCDGMN